LVAVLHEQVIRVGHLASDDDLIAGVVRGDGDSLTELFRRRHKDVYRFALHVGGSLAIAEDVVQEVFLAVMSDAARYQPGRGSVKAWLAGIARNHVRRHLDADRGRTGFGSEDEQGEPVAKGDLLGDLAREERLAALRRAVSSLPLRYREVVALCDLQELTYADAAVALGCAVGTVRSRLHRGRTLLAAKMTAQTGADHSSVNDSARCPA
jgi:RNA polymerase sigma-70 factor (ECF subfamily)